MTFEKEDLFEKALIERLSHKGWEPLTLDYPTEADLLRNWASILYENNRDIDKLNDTPLSDGEMQQIMEQIATLRTPLKLNGFINGKTVTIKRDNPGDALHFGKEVSLKIYDRQEIAAGQSRYQIARQPVFSRRVPLLNDRRGDLILLINGMPVIHIELKRSGIPVSQACTQIEKYAHEGLFTGIFSLIQIFVAMQPTDTVYFANPGPDGKFNRDYYFHWADFYNEPINDWERIASDLLSIPMAHQLIGFYTVADDSDGILKVMRSYQYYAANKISDQVSKRDWTRKDQHGGYIWHTTGSGKTMTSFKSAQLIANSRDADKVVFLMDRIELGTQSLAEYRAFADDSDDVQATENTAVLIAKLKSTAPADTLIVTSIQKMSNIKEGEGALKAHDIVIMTAKRIVFIVDEAHRSTFGDMLRGIKDTFYNAFFFGFTGTPIMDENQKKHNMTSDIFGSELHRYSIADGIRDKNVLGFDPYKVLTYKDRDLRRAVALEKAKAVTEAEAIANPKKSEVYYHYMDASKVPMAGYLADDGKYVKGIEDELPCGQYERSAHQEAVVEDILANWVQLSHDGKFHALFATSSIPEAIVYYRLIKQHKPDLKISALFDPNIDNDGGETDQSKEERQARALFKEDGLLEIMQDYNVRYQQNFDMGGHARFKKDMANRLAHKEPYTRIAKTPDLQLDLLIVVDQMLTGFDSKWINTLYMDKLMQYESIIQAFSRTNRLFGHEKPFGTIRYYRKPHTMDRNIQEAVKLYSGDKPFGLFAQRLGENLKKMNTIYQEIVDLFISSGVPDFERLPDDKTERGKFAVLFKELNEHLEAAKIQGFKWEQGHYDLFDPAGKLDGVVEMEFSQEDYIILVQRYKELSEPSEPGESVEDVPYDIDGYLTEIDTGKIDADYMNSRFDKYLRALGESDASEALDELHKTFATLTQDEQKYANIFIHDIQSGNVVIAPGKAFRDYITEYQTRAKNDQIARLATSFGLDEIKLRRLLNAGVDDATINEYGRFDELKASVDRSKAMRYFEEREGGSISIFTLNIKIQELLKKFILGGGIDV